MRWPSCQGQNFSAQICNLKFAKEALPSRHSAVTHGRSVLAVFPWEQRKLRAYHFYSLEGDAAWDRILTYDLVADARTTELLSQWWGGSGVSWCSCKKVLVIMKWNRWDQGDKHTTCISQTPSSRQIHQIHRRFLKQVSNWKSTKACTVHSTKAPFGKDG